MHRAPTCLHCSRPARAGSRFCSQSCETAYAHARELIEPGRETVQLQSAPADRHAWHGGRRLNLQNCA